MTENAESKLKKAFFDFFMAINAYENESKTSMYDNFIDVIKLAKKIGLETMSQLMQEFVDIKCGIDSCKLQEKIDTVNQTEDIMEYANTVKQIHRNKSYVDLVKVYGELHRELEN